MSNDTKTEQRTSRVMLGAGNDRPIIIRIEPGERAAEAANAAFDIIANAGVSAELTVEYAPFNVFPESEVRGLFSLAGIEITAIHEAANRYWGNRIETRVLCASSPWWIVETPHGVIVLGWRKRVLHIEWPSTPARVVVTEDNVTKCETHVHAYSKADAVKYLTTLAVELKRKPTP